MFGNGYFNPGASGGGGGTPSGNDGDVQLQLAGSFSSNPLFNLLPGAGSLLIPQIIYGARIHNSTEPESTLGEIRSYEKNLIAINMVNITTLVTNQIFYSIVGLVCNFSFQFTITPTVVGTITSFDIDTNGISFDGTDAKCNGTGTTGISYDTYIATGNGTVNNIHVTGKSISFGVAIIVKVIGSFLIS